MGTQLPFPKNGQGPPQFSTHVYCAKTAGWIKMPLGMEVGLGPGHIVLHGDPAHPQRGTAPSVFSWCLLWPISATADHLLTHHIGNCVCNQEVFWSFHFLVTTLGQLFINVNKQCNLLLTWSQWCCVSPIYRPSRNRMVHFLPHRWQCRDQ